jgi:hypothetical protein
MTIQQPARRGPHFVVELRSLLAADRRADALVRFMHQLDTPSEQIAGMRGSPVWPMLEAVAPTLYGSGRMGSNLVGSAATGKYDAVRHGRRSGSRLSHVYHRRQRTRPR